MECKLVIANSLGQPITRLDSWIAADCDVRDPDLGTTIECELESLPLLPGRYRIDVSVRAKAAFQDGLLAAAYFDVEPGVVGGRAVPVQGHDGDVILPHVWRLPR
jgi:lipopolysaccharide transport system ATP-binding protein